MDFDWKAYCVQMVNGRPFSIKVGWLNPLLFAIAKEFNPKLKLIRGFERKGIMKINLAEETGKKNLKVEILVTPLTAQEFMDEFPKFVWLWNDPLADSSSCTSFFLSKLAFENMWKLALSGGRCRWTILVGTAFNNEPHSLRTIC